MQSRSTPSWLFEQKGTLAPFFVHQSFAVLHMNSSPPETAQPKSANRGQNVTCLYAGSLKVSRYLLLFYSTFDLLSILVGLAIRS